MGSRGRRHVRTWSRRRAASAGELPREVVDDRGKKPPKPIS
jgi:hypothetical protein